AGVGRGRGVGSEDAPGLRSPATRGRLPGGVGFGLCREGGNTHSVPAKAYLPAPEPCPDSCCAPLAPEPTTGTSLRPASFHSLLPSVETRFIWPLRRSTFVALRSP